MKTHLFLGLVVILAAGSISVRGEDNPAQAAARAALVKMLMELNPPHTATAQTNSLAPTTPPSPAAPVVSVPPPAPVVPPGGAGVPARAAISTAPPTPVVSPAPPSPPASNGAKKQSKSSWDLATQPADTTAPQTNTAPAAFFVPPPSSVRTATMSVPVAAAPVATTSPAPAAPVKVQQRPPPRTVTVNGLPAPVKTGTDIVTIYGTVYKNAAVEKADSDGLIISYSTPNGGLGMTKVDYKDLPYEVRVQYHK